MFCMKNGLQDSSLATRGLILSCKLADLKLLSTNSNVTSSTPVGAEPHFNVICDDGSVLAASKPNRLLVHRTDIDFHEPHNLRDLLNKTRKRDAWLQPVHRLDKPTSGIVLFATPGKALNALKLEFVQRRTKSAIGQWSAGGRTTKVWWKNPCLRPTIQPQKRRGPTTEPLPKLNCLIQLDLIKRRDTASSNAGLKQDDFIKSVFTSGICVTQSWATQVW